MRVLNRTKGVVEDVICNFLALSNARGLIEVPMDAEINAALAIFFFRLR